MTPIFSFRFDLNRGRNNRDVLVLFVATGELDVESLASAIEDEIDVNLTPDEVAIVVREPLFGAASKALGDSPVLTTTLRRLRGRTTVILMAYDVKGKEVNRHHVSGPESTFELKFSDFSRRAVTDIFSKRGGFVESTPTYHFENPSGRHTERFIRLSNILVQGAEIAFIGFAALPFIPAEAKIAYLDTPSLYAVISAINEQRSSFTDAPPPLLADNFRSYGGLEGYNFTRQTEALAIISASSSGGMAGRLTREFGFEPTKIIHLLYLGANPAPPQCVCDLSRDIRYNPNGYEAHPSDAQPGSCPMCAANSVPIKLQGDQFDIAGPQHEPILIKKMDAPAGLAELMRRLAGNDVFCVGLGSTSSKTFLRQFTVRPAALLATAAFQQRLQYVIKHSIPASLAFVIPIDAGSQALAEQVVASTANGAQVVQRDALSAIPRTTTGAVAIVGTVIESGRSLQDLSRDLRSVCPEAPLVYLVGLSKTTGEERREALSRNLAQTDRPVQHAYVSVDQIVLPISSERNAWRSELDLLQHPEVSALVPSRLREYIYNRIIRLRRSSEPLINELFLPNNPTRSLFLQTGFVFWPRELTEAAHSQADVYFTISSVLQRLRANAHVAGKLSSIRSNWFQQTILDPGNFGRFYDDIIQACLLRASSPYEMNYSNSPRESKELARLIRRIVEAYSTARGGAAAEFLLALATERIRLCPADRNYVLETRIPQTNLVKFFLDVCLSRFADQ